MMSFMINNRAPISDKPAGQIRHLLNTVGAVLVTTGYVSGDQVAPLVDTVMVVGGAGLTLGSFIWSWISKN